MGMFKYSFQKVVDLKSSQKTQAEWELSNALGVLSEEEITHVQLLETKSNWEKKLQEASEDRIPLAQLQVIREYIDYIDTCIDKKKSELKKAQLVVDQSRSALTEKMMDEKVWLKARGHAQEQFRLTHIRMEQNELDEMATVRYIVPTP